MRSSRRVWPLLVAGSLFAACSESGDGGGASGSGAVTSAGGSSATGGTVAGRGSGGSSGSGVGGSAGTNSVAGSGGAGNSGGTTGGAMTGGGGSGASSGSSSGGVGGDTGGSSGGANGDAGEGSAGTPPTGWLYTEGNRILTGVGQPFHGRGANLHDTRSCDACTWLEPNPEGLMVWADQLIDEWNANFIRFNLWSFPDDGGFRLSYQNVVDDPEYLSDVVDVVEHMTGKPGVYVMVTVFIDSTMNPDGELHATWPTEATLPVYETLAEAFVNNPKVLFGQMNQPHDDESENDALAAIFTQAIDTIRAVETANGTPQHIIVAQGTQTWARETTYWIENPLGPNIAYEVHAYNPPSDFEWLIVEPARQIPLLIGEFGHSEYQTIEEAKELMALCEENDVPWIAWNFHQRCPPNFLEDTGGSEYDGCGFEGAGTEYTFPITEWGQAVKDRLAMPW